MSATAVMTAYNRRALFTAELLGKIEPQVVLLDPRTYCLKDRPPPQPKVNPKFAVVRVENCTPIQT